MDPDRLREMIIALRRERQWGMSQVIEYLGFSPSFVYYLLSGERQPDLLTADRIAEKLGCSVEDFTVETHEPMDLTG